MRPSNPWLNVLLWVLLSFATLFPIYWLFVISVKPAVDLFTTPDVILRSVYWKNYIEVLGEFLQDLFAVMEDRARGNGERPASELFGDKRQSHSSLNRSGQ